MTSTNVVKSNTRLEYITEGTFGKIYTYPSEPVVYKVVKEDNHGIKLEEEYQLYIEISQCLDRPDNESKEGFKVPKPIAYFRNEKSSKILKIHDLKHSNLSSILELENEFNFPVFSIEKINSLNIKIINEFKNLFFSNELKLFLQEKEKEKEENQIRLFRLYFGREDIPIKIENLKEGIIKTDLSLDLKKFKILDKILKEKFNFNLPCFEFKNL
ncbi:uncharacterized protein I206_106487 [Kwoniella pini CBS 10737]|uniref:Protein kinase domain-containing protein n=1 Tax=Kwoniella pini CBS 10737 TaxID=1296096 RepID=A0A1B9HUG2_9TREE|nr:uncharacterized protein I206_07292 [Kwoniella pini CBS 10737]OCF46905.1 hypothetical protein I206_07292 [Kwoniella pini CBS 10737]